MNSYDLRNLQEAYMEVIMREERDVTHPHWETNLQFKKSEKKNKGLLTVKQKRKEDRERNRNPLFGPSDKMTKSQRQILILKQAFPEYLGAFKREHYDLYDLVLSHLLDEGYAETPEAAEVMMVNMSEEWRESIMEAKVDNSLRGQQKKAVRNNRTFGNTTSYSKSKATKERHNIHRAKRNLTKLRGDKSEESSASILNQSSRVHRSKNSGYNRDGSHIG